MKRIIIIAALLGFCAGCHIPYPSSGRRTLQPYERYEEVCTTKVDKKGEKTRKCQWVRSR
jgi:hypothetical protein